MPWSNNQFLADTMPNSVAHRLDAGHFAWEEAAGEYGRLFRSGSQGVTGSTQVAKP